MVAITEPVALKKSFIEAGLDIYIAATPREFDKRVRDDVKSFLLDIRKAKNCGKNEKKQTYVMYPGEGNFVNVQAVDAKLQQLILQVQEPDRIVTTERWEIDRKTFERKLIVEKTQVPSELRTFLLGMDEKHLFIAQLPTSSVQSVKDAHKVLKPSALKNKQQKRTVYRRQGEWFFTKATEKEQYRLDKKLEEYYTAEVKDPDVTFNSRVGMSSGRPHVGSIVIRLGNDNFVKGDVKHPDHKTCTFNVWHKVFKNTEVANNQIKGMKWID